MGIDAVGTVEGVVLTFLMSVFVGEIEGELLVAEAYACGVDVGVAEVGVLETGGTVDGKVILTLGEVGIEFYGVPICSGAVNAADIVVACTYAEPAEGTDFDACTEGMLTCEDVGVVGGMGGVLVFCSPGYEIAVGTACLESEFPWGCEAVGGIVVGLVVVFVDFFAVVVELTFLVFVEMGDDALVVVVF